MKWGILAIAFIFFPRWPSSFTGWPADCLNTRLSGFIYWQGLSLSQSISVPGNELLTPKQ